MARTDEAGNWIDATGQAVPRKYVAPIEKARDALVERVFREAEAEHERLARLRKLAEEAIDGYLEGAAKKAGLERNPGGNYTLMNFSGDKRVMLKQVSFIEFDERLQFAKAKIDQCLGRWSEGANANLRAVVFDAFKVDVKGRVDTKRILGLRRLAIKDREWQEAMELISQAVSVVSRKAYLLFQRRADGGEWETLRLDFAAL